MSIDEILEEYKNLESRHAEIMAMDKDEFLSDSITKELLYIHKRFLELVREWPT